MRITVRSAAGVSEVSVLLTEREADDLARALRSRLQREPGYEGPGYHLHIDDGEGSELIIGVLDAE